MAKVYATPGVYIEEKSAFPNSAVAVATAVPAFVGYTEKAIAGKKNLSGIPTKISSYGEFMNYFGAAPKTTFTVAPVEGSTDYTLTPDEGTMYYLHSCMRMFFANGGSDCYIISVGQYGGETPAKIDKAQLIAGIDSLKKEPEPTMLVLPDAMLLPEQECYDIQTKMLSHCGSDMRNRFAILDVYRGWLARTPENAPDPVDTFRSKIGQNFLQWGAAYYPWIDSTAVQADEVGLANVSSVDPLKALLKAEADLSKEQGLINEKRATDIHATVDKIGAEDADPVDIHQTLLAVSPTYKDVLTNMRNTLNRLPTATAMAGVYSMVDNQEDLNLPLNGKAVNAIRTFPGKGVLVWGARTLDGNSADWRYISVRRTMIMFEQSIKAAAEAYVFAPNTATTWTNLKALITNFLTNEWQKGALAGATAFEAFSVDVGLGATMTPQDILDGMMKITVKVAITRPAEFIVITFQQQMQQS